MIKPLLEFATVVVAVAGIALSGITAYFGYKSGKTALYREKLYTRQLDAYERVVEALGTLQHELLSNLLKTSVSVDKDARPGLSEQVLENIDSLMSVYRKCAIFLSADFRKAISEYLELFNSIVRDPEKKIPDEDAIEKFIDAFQKVYTVAVKDLRVSPLDEEGARLFGRKPE